MIGNAAGSFLSSFFNRKNNKEREQKKRLEEAAFEKKLADIRGGSLVLNPDGTTAKAPDVDYTQLTDSDTADHLQIFLRNLLLFYLVHTQHLVL